MQDEQYCLAVHMIFRTHDVQTMIDQPFLHFGEEPITCSKSSDEDDMLGSCQFIRASIYIEGTH